MSGKTKIEWSDAVWNPTVGCTRVSDGCRFCYAFELHDKRYKANRDAARSSTHAWPSSTEHWDDAERIRLARAAGNLPLPEQYDVPFSRVQLMPDRLDKPLHWKKPRKVFVNSMSDLFHPDVPDEFIDRVFAVMALTPQHTYQVLTKRPERMRAYVGADGRAKAVYIASLPIRMTGNHYAESPKMEWPLPNVWLGTSAENQAMLDERVVHLLATPAAVRFLSCEPLLGPVDLMLGHEVYSHYDRPSLLDASSDWCALDRPNGISWVIVGGESGPHARPCNVEWIRSIVAQCQAADVPVFVKQLGSRPYRVDGYEPLAITIGPGAGASVTAGRGELRSLVKLRSRHGIDPEEWPEDLRVREFPSEVQRD